jgi:hypothetical protein
MSTTNLPNGSQGICSTNQLGAGGKEGTKKQHTIFEKFAAVFTPIDQIQWKVAENDNHDRHVRRASNVCWEERLSCQHLVDLGQHMRTKVSNLIPGTASRVTETALQPMPQVSQLLSQPAPISTSGA